MESLRFLLASLALGAIAVWASEFAFWTAPPAPPAFGELALTWLAYSAACGCALSAVILTGCGGLTGAFLGGAILGWIVEGVVVGTMYDAFPFQLVWTPLAWHALVSGVAVFAVGRIAVHWPLQRQLGWLAGLGMCLGIWGWYWPVERQDLPGLGGVLSYLAGLGLAVPAGNLVLDRLGRLPRPPRWVLAVPWALAATVWVASGLADPRPVRLLLPMLVALTLWAMLCLGRAAPDIAGFGTPAGRPYRHALFLLAPLIAAPVAVFGWHRFGAVEVNVPAALVLGGFGLGWWGRLLWRAYRVRSAASAPARSSTPS